MVLRVTAVLGAFDEGHRVLSLSELSRRSALPLTTVHRLCADLVAGELLVRREEDGRYEVGGRLWRLGMLAPHAGLRELALPPLQDLVSATGHTVDLAVLEGSRALVVERLAGTRGIRTRHNPGGRLPLHCTAVGKALLAQAPDDVIAEVLADLSRHTPFTVTDPRVLQRQLAEVRRTGLSRSAQEHRLGMSGMAVPVPSSGPGAPVVAIGLIAALSSPRLDSAVPHLRAAAATVGAYLARGRPGSPA